MIKFVIHPSRKGKSESNFDGRLSGYWQKQFYDLFRNW